MPSLLWGEQMKKNPDQWADYGFALDNALLLKREEEGALELAHEDALVRHSDAGKCSRAIQYKVRGVEPEPHGATTLYTFAIGTGLHEMYQDVLTSHAEYNGWEIELEKKIHVPEAYSAGHLDALIHKPEGKETVEIKTINGTGYKSAIGLGRYEAGPRYSAFLQSAINAVATGSETMRVVYLPLEVVSLSVARKKGIPNNLRHFAQWTYNVSEFVEIGDAELERFRWIVESERSGRLVPRHIPDPELPSHSKVTNPNTGTVVGLDGTTGRTWQCDYCDFRNQCLEDGP